MQVGDCLRREDKAKSARSASRRMMTTMYSRDLTVVNRSDKRRRARIFELGVALDEAAVLPMRGTSRERIIATVRITVDIIRGNGRYRPQLVRGEANMRKRKTVGSRCHIHRVIAGRILHLRVLREALGEAPAAALVGLEVHEVVVMEAIVRCRVQGTEPGIRQGIDDETT